MIFKATSTQIRQCLENIFIRGYSLLTPRVRPRCRSRVRGVTFDWYQSYGLVSSRTTLARMSLAIHALMLVLNNVTTSDG